ncbi:hypothetical protein ACJ41O_008700 [Fusarium nematophilum]
MSTPRIKRQFAGAAADPSQRQITSFFNPRSSTDPVDAEAEPARQPALPSSVQANLLSVGMRVRKSVPEGYKTVGTSAFKLWTDNAPMAAASTTTTPTRRAPTKALSRELLPFCGINKVGGLDTQPEFERDDDDDGDVPDLDAIPELTMSQESNDSVDSHEASRKRIFDEDDGDELDAGPGTLIMGSQGNSRVLAVPVSRAQKAAGFKDVGQENVKTGSDFGEAEFLVYGAEREMDLAN